MYGECAMVYDIISYYYLSVLDHGRYFRHHSLMKKTLDRFDNYMFHKTYMYIRITCRFIIPYKSSA